MMNNQIAMCGKRMCAVAWLLVLTVTAAGQGRQSDSLYAEGVALYQKGHFEQAARLFEQVDSLDRATMPDNKNRNSYGNMWLASCCQRMGKTERARALDFFGCELPPVDRRLTVRSDSLCTLADKQMEQNDPETALTLFQAAAQLEEQELGGPTWFSVNTWMNIGYSEVKLGRYARGTEIVEQQLALAAAKYGQQSRFMMAHLQTLFVVYSETGDKYQAEQTAERLWQLVEHLGEQQSDFAENVLEQLITFYANTLNTTQLNATQQRLCQVVAEKHGEKSVQTGLVWHSIAKTYSKMNRHAKAAEWADKAQRMLAQIEGTEAVDCRVIALMQLAQEQFYLKQMKQAKATVKECMSLAKEMSAENSELVAPSLLSLMLTVQSQQGKVGKKLLEEARQMVEDVARRHGRDSQVYALSSVALVQALMLAQQPIEAAAIAEQDLELYDRMPQLVPMFTACFAFLETEQFVKARKVSSRMLQRLNDELASQHYAALTAAENKTLIDNGLQLVSRYMGDRGISEDQSFHRDTVGYSLGMIQQDLLLSNLLIQEHTGQLGTPDFMHTLYRYAKTAVNMTHDQLMADSIVHRFQGRLLTAFGDTSAQYREASLILDRCEFERSADGRSLYFRMCLAEGEPQYDSVRQQYDEGFDQWLNERRQASLSAGAAAVPAGSAGGNGTPPKQAKPEEPQLPYMTYIVRNRDFQAGVDSCLTYMTYYMEKPDAPKPYLSRFITALSDLCVYSDSIGKSEGGAALIKMSATMLAEEGDTTDLRWNLAALLRTAWIHLPAEEYEEVERQMLPLVKDPADEVRAAVLLAVAQWIGNTDTWALDKRHLVARALPALDQAIARVKNKDRRNEFFLLRTCRLWSSSFTYKVERDSLADDFLHIMHLLESEPRLLAYRESYNAMSMLCDITTGYSREDSRTAVRADQLRRAAKRACIRRMEEKNRQHEVVIASWPSLSPIGQSFRCTITTDYYGDEDQLQTRIHLAYYDCKMDPRAEDENTVGDITATWEEIRQKQRGYGYSDQLPSMIERLTRQVVQKLHNASPELCRLAYDIALFSKGYMLRSEQQLLKVIRQSGNRTVISQMEQYIATLQQLDNTSLAHQQRAQLKQQAEKLWSDLRYRSRTFDDYTRSLELSWRDVQAQLKDDEVAIEYVDDGERYFALVLRRGSEAPLAVEVGWKGRWTGNDSLYTVRGKYSSPWPSYALQGDSVVRPLDGVSTIYVSPSGILHQLALEAVYDLYTDSLMSERYHICRLSSTRDLIEQRQTLAQKRKAMLFGGIDYSLDPEVWNQLAAAKQGQAQPLVAMRDVPALSRGAVAAALVPLEGSLEEVSQIAGICRQAQVSVSNKTGADATEEEVKRVSSSDVTILHVATHGFWQSQQAAADSAAISFSKKDDSQENNALSRCGLFMAGAAAAFEGQAIPGNMDDGILTAREISHLDFTNLSLVVLSACESGLGDITGDGVFGLQRGFKKAGAQSILMSLWKVDDEATCLLMTEFYRHWMGLGHSKRDALEQAKRVIRSHRERGWDDPHYWAAFILLDARD